MGYISKKTVNNSTGPILPKRDIVEAYNLASNLTSGVMPVLTMGQGLNVVEFLGFMHSAGPIYRLAQSTYTRNAIDVVALRSHQES